MRKEVAYFNLYLSIIIENYLVFLLFISILLPLFLLLICFQITCQFYLQILNTFPLFTWNCFLTIRKDNTNSLSISHHHLSWEQSKESGQISFILMSFANRVWNAFHRIYLVCLGCLW